jgi:hypothetical protein
VHRIQKSFMLMLLDNPQLHRYFCLEHQFNTKVIDEMKGLEMVRINLLNRPYTNLKNFKTQIVKSNDLLLIYILLNSKSGSTNT